VFPDLPNFVINTAAVSVGGDNDSGDVRQRSLVPRGIHATVKALFGMEEKHKNFIGFNCYKEEKHKNFIGFNCYKDFADDQN
jgi:hypothetical protein